MPEWPRSLLLTGLPPHVRFAEPACRPERPGYGVVRPGTALFQVAEGDVRSQEWVQKLLMTALGAKRLENVSGGSSLLTSRSPENP
jgi:hypothetical protein